MYFSLKWIIVSLLLVKKELSKMKNNENQALQASFSIKEELQFCEIAHLINLTDENRNGVEN
jgi:hypothetical protein